MAKRRAKKFNLKPVLYGVVGLLIGLLLAAAIFVIWPQTVAAYNALKIDYAREAVILLLLSLPSFLLIYVVSQLLVLLPRIKEKFELPIITIVAVFGTFLVGLLFLHYVVGVPNIDWPLFDDSNQQVGKVICTDKTERLLADSWVSCRIEGIKAPAENVTGILTFRVAEGHDEAQAFEGHGFSFTASSDYLWMDVTIWEQLPNDLKRARVGNPIFFRTLEQERERHDSFTGYFLALLGLSVFAVPALMKEIIPKK